MCVTSSIAGGIWSEFIVALPSVSLFGKIVMHSLCILDICLLATILTGMILFFLSCGEAVSWIEAFEARAFGARRQEPRMVTTNIVPLTSAGQVYGEDEECRPSSSFRKSALSATLDDSPMMTRENDERAAADEEMRSTVAFPPLLRVRVKNGQAQGEIGGRKDGTTGGGTVPVTDFFIEFDDLVERLGRLGCRWKVWLFSNLVAWLLGSGAILFKVLDRTKKFHFRDEFVIYTTLAMFLLLAESTSRAVALVNSRGDLLVANGSRCLQGQDFLVFTLKAQITPAYLTVFGFPITWNTYGIMISALISNALLCARIIVDA